MTPPPKKSLGQCFLVERGYAEQIARAVAATSPEIVLEVGPGRGILTEELLRSGLRVVAVEIDGRLIEPLQKKFAGEAGFTLRHEDFLTTDLLRVIPARSFAVTGNLPYHLVSQVLFKLIHHAQAARRDAHLPWPECAVVMMQAEVAERVVAAPGGKAWSRISVFTQLEATAHELFLVPAGAFRPTPKVDGAVVQFDFLRLPPSYPADYSLLERMVQHTFHQRRKMLKSSLSSLAGVHPYWKNADLDFRRRPETLSCAEWVQLADAVSAARAGA